MSPIRTADPACTDVVRRAIWPEDGFKGKGTDIVAFLRSRGEHLNDDALSAIEAMG